MLVDRGPFRRVALKSYISQMSTPNPKVVFDDYVAEIVKEQGFSWEEEPRSIYDPQQLYTALERYATDVVGKWDNHMEFGFRKAFKIFAKPKGREWMSPLNELKLVTAALKLSKSSGLPMMTKKADSLAYSLDRESQIRKGLKAPNPCVAYKRTQKGNKTRLVWGYPLEMVIMEARFARPLIDHFKRAATPMAIGMSKVELGSKLFTYFEDRPGTTVCLDYSKYDSTISAEMIRRAFVILATWFSRADQEALGWNTIVRYFTCTPIVMPNGHLYTGKNHGVPSGSYFTQLIDSVVNVALCYALSHRFGFSFEERGLYVLGDDSIMKVRGKVSLSEWSSYLEGFGMILHGDEKTVVGEEHFLGAFWKKGKPDAPIAELASKATFPETYRKHGSTVTEKKRGAEDVVRNYACSYKSAWQLVPNDKPFMMMWLDKPRIAEQVRPELWSATDRFFFEELGQLEAIRGCDAAISMRYLL